MKNLMMQSDYNDILSRWPRKCNEDLPIKKHANFVNTISADILQLIIMHSASGYTTRAIASARAEVCRHYSNM